jgi:signal transduction histidine kinase
MVDPYENSIDQLITLFNHELRTPITCLQGAIELLQAYQQTHVQKDPTELKELLSLAATSTDRLTHAIENILDWYEITQARKNLFKQPCNITLLLQHVIAALQPFATAQHIQIRLDTPASVAVNADQYYLSRALSHLIHNAIKFSSPDHSVSITVTLVQTENTILVLNLPYVLITVEDQGVGIPEAALEQIFQPFHQVDTSDDRHYEGLGLELAICREVIQQHQGKIWVESQLGQGSTFYLALPMDESADLQS